MKKISKSRYNISLWMGAVALLALCLPLHTTDGGIANGIEYLLLKVEHNNFYYSLIALTCVAIFTIAVSFVLLKAKIKKDMITPILCVLCIAIELNIFTYGLSIPDQMNMAYVMILPLFISVGLFFAYILRTPKKKKQSYEGEAPTITFRYKAGK